MMRGKQWADDAQVIIIRRQWHGVVKAGKSNLKQIMNDPDHFLKKDQQLKRKTVLALQLRLYITRYEKKSKLLAGKEYSVTREKEKGQSHELKLETITYNHHYSTGVLN